MQTITVADPGGLHTEAGSPTWDPTIAAPTSSTSVPTQTSDPAPPPGGIAGQQIALASYINPLADPDAWSRLIGYDSSKVSVLIANVLNGPDSVADTNWQKVINSAISSGKRVIGYVRTGYLGVSQQQFTTRLGSHDLADWVSQIESDIDKWYELYGSGMGGIFFDEGWNDCGPDNIYSNLYAHINTYTKRRYPGAYTVLNPGSTMPQCFENTMDTLLTFESSYEAYTSSYTPNDWTPTDSRKIWHIIYNVPASAVSTVAALAKQRGAGLIEVTNDVLDNPYDTLPDDSYIQSFMSAVEGGSAPVTEAVAPAGGPAAATPGTLSVTSSDYSSVSLSWGSSANAVAYNVYMNGKQVLSLPSSMTRVTVGMIDPGTSGLSFSVKAVGGSNVESAGSNSASASTMPLPGGKSIINVHAAPQAGFTTYTADVLVPYSFVRVYITYSESTGTCDFTDHPAWPVNYNTFSFYCGVYMVENTNMYRYSGTITKPSANIPWAWSLVGAVPVDQTGYTYTWVVPVGSSTMDTTSFVIQTQGYGPAADVFSPCPTLGGGPTGGNFCA
ncbi:Spherulation-specific family 4-domain-containing protein [Diaporthe sp. PMI_573]|nr:Spherulation-specific family 4-domain-containing protein [Diaporthaceae sp. PMI_573]